MVSSWMLRFQSNVLHTIVAAPWYVPNTVIRRDLQTPTVKGEIRHYSSQCSARLSVHPNGLVDGQCLGTFKTDDIFCSPHS
jgi:hypothetical protein